MRRSAVLGRVVYALVVALTMVTVVCVFSDHAKATASVNCCCETYKGDACRLCDTGATGCTLNQSGCGAPFECCQGKCNSDGTVND